MVHFLCFIEQTSCDRTAPGNGDRFIVSYIILHHIHRRRLRMARSPQQIYKHHRRYVSLLLHNYRVYRGDGLQEGVELSVGLTTGFKDILMQVCF